MTQTFDPYRALGVRRDATETEVKAAHRRLAKRFHPDAVGGDSARFLRVQEAYKLLSDPLLRREWDTSHAPGPLRADRPATGPAASRAKAPRRPAQPAREPATGHESSTAAEGAAQEPPSRRPRSSRAYTWSAADVPWWEEGHSENRRQPGRKRPARPAGPAASGPAQSTGQRRPEGSARPKGAPGPDSPPPPADAPSAFDVYNRSSGAAWSMAARAYFRRGDQDLPRRGTFQYQGTQVLTGARARTHAEAEAKRRAAEPARPAHTDVTPGATSTARPAYAYAAGVSHDAQQIYEARRAWQRRTSAAAWPSLRERLVYALLAWVPIALAIGYGSAVATGCDVASVGCPTYLETAQAVAIALVLGVLVGLPKLAYVGAMSTIGSFFIGLVVVGILAVAPIVRPDSILLAVIVGLALAVGYVATAAFVILRDPRSRPWYAGPPG